MDGNLRSNVTEQRHRLCSRPRRLTRRTSVLVVALAMLLVGGITQGAEDVSNGARALNTIVIIDRGLLYPGTLTVHQGDTLEFQNFSSESVMFMFIEPKNAADELRCRPTDNTSPTAGAGKVARWPLFTSGPSHELTVTTPPGRFSSACSLAPGRYVFVTKRIGRDPRSPAATLGDKGTISVE